MLSLLIYIMANDYTPQIIASSSIISELSQVLQIQIVHPKRYAVFCVVIAVAFSKVCAGFGGYIWVYMRELYPICPTLTYRAR
jgi:hypothetical protein